MGLMPDIMAGAAFAAIMAAWILILASL